MLPHWAKDGGFAALLVRLRDPAVRRRIREDITSERGSDGLMLVDGHWDKVWLAESVKNPQFSGKSLAEIASARGLEPSLDIVSELLLEEESEIDANVAGHDEGDIQEIVAHPLSMIESDAGVSVSDTALVNPRGYAAFPITFRRYVRGEARHGELQGPGRSILTLQEAVRKMTSMPAQRMGLRDRGLVREGMWADLVLFDATSIADRATEASPHEYPVGIDYVLVNGEVVVDKGKHTGKLPGHVLRHA
jgi:N-acyl-D-amino-acid deacylase